jgi:hypothetical protein
VYLSYSCSRACHSNLLETRQKFAPLLLEKSITVPLQDEEFIWELEDGCEGASVEDRVMGEAMIFDELLRRLGRCLEWRRGVNPICGFMYTSKPSFGENPVNC